MVADSILTYWNVLFARNGDKKRPDDFRHFQATKIVSFKNGERSVLIQRSLWVSYAEYSMKEK